MKTERMAAGALLDNFFQANECAAADEQDVRGIHRGEFLVRVLTAALGRHVGDGSFKNFQQRLLDALAAHVARDRRVFVLLGNLIDFVDIDDALLRLLNISIGGLQQLQNDVFDVFADVAGFGKRRRVHYGERHIQHARERLRQKCLARARGTNQKDVRLAQLDIARLLVQENAFVMIVDRHREFLLRAVLPNDVPIEKLLDLRRTRKPARGRGSLFALLILKNGLANADTFVADISARIVRRRADQLFDLFLSLVAEGTAQRLVWIEFFHWCEGLVSAGLRRSLYPYSRPIYP